MTDQAALVDEITTLLRTPVSGEPTTPSLARLEDTLTSGYAHALALEAERWRLERRIGEVATTLADDIAGQAAGELGMLAREMARTDDELTRLRALLATLRDRAREARTA